MLLGDFTVLHIIRRALSLFLVFVGLAILIFLIARIVPGDPARIALGPLASAEQVAEMRREMGLDEPFFVQLWQFLSGLAQGDLGKSLLSSRPVMDDIKAAQPVTLELVLFTIVLQIAISIDSIPGGGVTLLSGCGRHRGCKTAIIAGSICASSQQAATVSNVL